ncbi:MAG: zinc dependent phospholipase C family protein [Bacillota bacterium]
MNLLENTYGNFLKLSFLALNPFKKAVIKTECKVHKFINIQALEILKNDQYTDVYRFYQNYILQMNDGTYWADQDFKSSSHFYHPVRKKGMYGRKSAMDLGRDYYAKALELWKIGEINRSMFYFGAALHIIQDMTIPQHANVKLLDNHRQYENFVKRTYLYVNTFKATNGAIIFDSINEYIRFNTRVAMKIYNKFKVIKDNDQRYYRTTNCILPLAERTTAGCMITFYKEIFQKNLH